MYNIAKFDIARVWAEGLFAFVAFFGLIQKGEDTFCRRQTALQGLHHAGHAFNGVKHHDHARQKRHEIACTKAGKSCLAGGCVNNRSQSNRGH